MTAPTSPLHFAKKNALLLSATILSSIFYINTSLAQATPETKTAPPAAKSDTPREDAPSFTETRAPALRYTLSNGLQVAIIKDPLAPVVQTMVNYSVGSANAPKNFPGNAHALEHMMFNGTPNISRSQLASISSRLGNHNNADTTSDVTQYYFEAPAENLEILLKIEADRMQEITLDPKEWAHEKGAIEQEVSRDLSNPAYRYLTQLRAILFKNTPYERDALGDRTSFDKTTAEDLHAFYNTWYAPNNAILVIAGDVDPKKTLELVKKYFGKIAPKRLPDSPEIIPGTVKQQDIVLPTDYPVSFEIQAWRMPGMRDPDYATAQILADTLASERGNLFALVPAGEALEAGFSYQAEAQGGMGLAFIAYPKGQPRDVFKRKLSNILNQYRQNGIPEKLITAAKKNEIANLAFKANSISGLAESWSEALAIQHLNSPKTLSKAFDKVTKKDVDALLRKWLLNTNVISASLRPSDKGHAIAAQGFGGTENLLSDNGENVTLPEWAEKALGHAHAPTPIVPPKSYILPNGLQLLVQPETVSNTIELFGEIRQNAALQDPKGQEGVSDLTDALFLYGSTKHNQKALAAAFDSLCASESAGSHFSLSVRKPDFSTSLSLLAEHELTPAFPAEGFTKTRSEMAEARKGEMTSPAYHFNRAIRKALVPTNDPTLREATAETIRQLKLQNVKNLYQKAYRPDLTTIFVIGNIQPEEAYQEILKNFGGWQKQGETPKLDLPHLPANKKSQTRILDPGRSQDEVKLVENLQIDVRDPDRHALAVGNQILGAGGFSSRLMKDLRVKSGFAYSAGSGIQYSRTRTGFEIGFGSDPEKALNAEKLAVKDLKQLQEAPPTEQEMALAKDSLLRSALIGRASFSGLASLWMTLEALNLPPETPNETMKAIENMQAEQVQKAFQRWIQPDNLARITLGPAPQTKIKAKSPTIKHA
ncbi:insulinase family protein [Acetobacteraceae bacterium]|nr:insulinase family protein [Acetobacteraceae bacterium]